MPPQLLVGVSLSTKTHVFHMDQATEQLYNVREIDHYASEATVIFLIEAARENKPTKRTYRKPDGSQGETTINTADRHRYVLFFDHDGNYRKLTEVDVDFTVMHIGIFPSGMILAFGYDDIDHSPKLAMLKEDGSLLMFLQIPKGYVPESMFGTKDNSGKGPDAYIAPTEFLPFLHSILIAQNKTDFPILQVDEGGLIRAIHPRLPTGIRIEGLIASDHNIYLRVGPGDSGPIYEMSPEGTMLRSFVLSEGRMAASVACVHDGKFLSFDHGEGKLVPLIGTAEPASTPER